MKGDRRPRSPLTAAQNATAKANLIEIISTLDEYRRALSAYFERTGTSAPELSSVPDLSRSKTGRTGRSGKGHPIAYSVAELNFIKRRRTMPRRDLHAKFIASFPRRDVNLDAIKALCSRKRWYTGRDGCFPKGLVPANKGKKMPFNANSARTQFKKGNRTGRANLVYKPVGAERASKEGYIERKINDGMPFNRRWRGVHLINWEKLHGTVPAGHVLKCLDGDKRNTDPANWDLVPRATLARLNKRWRGAFEAAPADLKLAMLAMAKLETGLGERKKAA